MNEIQKYRVLSTLYQIKAEELTYNESSSDMKPLMLENILRLIGKLQELGCFVSYTRTPNQIHTNALIKAKKLW